jgi:hypothetical protein
MFPQDVSSDTPPDEIPVTLHDRQNLPDGSGENCRMDTAKIATPIPKYTPKITHQSTGSINVARSRLRQKFGLTDSDTSLIAFLDRFKTPQD